MAFLVRKLNSRKNIELIGQADDINTMHADAATGEFRTKNGTLSSWVINKLEDLDEAVLAIVVTSTKLEMMDFIIINTDILDDNDLEYEQSFAGQIIPVADLQDTHFDIVNITIPKLLNCSNVYRQVFQNDHDRGVYIVRYAEGEIIDLLNRDNNRDRLDYSKLNKGIKKKIKDISN